MISLLIVAPNIVSVEKLLGRILYDASGVAMSTTRNADKVNPERKE